jgi:hypothetical protein
VRAVAPRLRFALPEGEPARHLSLHRPVTNAHATRGGRSIGSHQDGGRGGITGDDHLNVMNSTVTASIEWIGLMAGRPMRRPRRRLRNADFGERKEYVA